MTDHPSRPKNVERLHTIIVGDIHADFDTYRALLRREEAKAGRPLPSIQVGDYGIGYGSDAEAREVRRFHLAHRRHRFIRGNHDAPDEVVLAPGFIPDGTLSSRVLFLGGADNPRRGVRPWEDTEISEDEATDLLNRFRQLPEQPEVIISHDAPQSIAERLCAKGHARFNSRAAVPAAGALTATRTRLFLDQVYQLLQPSLWLFGHWHEPWAHQDGPTHFRCVGYHEAFTLPLPWSAGVQVD